MTKPISSSHNETMLDDVDLDTVVAGTSTIGTGTANRQSVKVSSGAATVFSAMGMQQAAGVS